MTLLPLLIVSIVRSIIIFLILLLPSPAYAKGSWEHERDEYGFIKASDNVTVKSRWVYEEEK